MTRRTSLHWFFLRKKSSSSYSLWKPSQHDSSPSRDSGIFDMFSSAEKKKSSSSSSPASPSSTTNLLRASSNKLFGKSLRQLCSNGKLPTPIMNMLRQLYLKAPFTVGIFRRSANARVCREIEGSLEQDPLFSLEDVSVIVVGAVFKDLLRSLPNCLLDSRLYDKWIEAVNSDDSDEIRSRVELLLKKLPSENLLLLKHLLCLLWHISNHSKENKMCSTNLAVCIGPSLLSSSKTFSAIQREEVSKSVPKLITFLIDHCPDLFGESILSLLGTELETRPRPDSGTDSMNSLQDVSSMSLQKDNVRAIMTSSSSSSEESETPSTSSPGVLRTLRPVVEYYPSNVVLHCMCYACQTTRGRTERELRRITWSPWSSLDTLV